MQDRSREHYLFLSPLFCESQGGFFEAYGFSLVLLQMDHYFDNLRLEENIYLDAGF